jgi:hypothetical protein
MEVLEKHECSKFVMKAKRNDDFHGPAIWSIEKSNRGWIAHNDEYASYINYCPFCGKKLD